MAVLGLMTYTGRLLQNSVSDCLVLPSNSDPDPRHRQAELCLPINRVFVRLLRLQRPLLRLRTNLPFLSQRDTLQNMSRISTHESQGP